MSTEPETETGVGPWKASVAVAPASTYADPNSTVTELEPDRVKTGGTLSLYPSSVRALIAATPAIATKAFCIADSSEAITRILFSFFSESGSLSSILFSSISLDFLAVSSL